MYRYKSSPAAVILETEQFSESSSRRSGKGTPVRSGDAEDRPFGLSMTAGVAVPPAPPRSRNLKSGFEIFLLIPQPRIVSIATIKKPIPMTRALSADIDPFQCVVGAAGPPGVRSMRGRE